MSEPTDPPAAPMLEDLTRERDDLRAEVDLLRGELRRLLSAVGAWRADANSANQAELEAALRAARTMAAER